MKSTETYEERKIVLPGLGKEGEEPKSCVPIVATRRAIGSLNPISTFGI